MRAPGFNARDTLPTVILGAGAAGLLAAVFAAARGRRVLLLERTRDGGRKILVSGGGRCNVLPSAVDPGRFVTDSSPNTLRKILSSWPLPEQRRFFEEEAGIPLALALRSPAARRTAPTRDGFLFTHRGYGGPAVLDLSHLSLRSRLAGGPPQPLFVQWTEMDAEAWDRLLRESSGTVAGVIRRPL